jgi:GxxExxY protein
MTDMNDVERLITLTLNCGLRIHREIGPGLLESVYERVLEDRLRQMDIEVDRQQPVNVTIDGKIYDDAFRYDLLIGKMLLVEVKSIERLGPIHIKQVLTYIRLMNLRYGLLLNFGCDTFKQGIRRVINDKFA